ncbi:hypothetical protein D9M69_551560 [compost metagenome]
MFSTRPLSRNTVSPASSTKPISAMASSTFSSDRRRMPLLTPETVDSVAINTDSRISSACGRMPSGMSNMNFSP